MLQINEALRILQSYNINSHKYGPTIYQKNNETGICLEIKDSKFGYLTRAFVFNEASELDEFLKKHTWYKNNSKKFNIEVSLDKYDTPTPIISYKHNNEILDIDTMFNLEKILKEKQETNTNEVNRSIYLTNIKGLANYLLNLIKTKEKNKEEKNYLKRTENDLKYDLLQLLATYYGKDKQFEKKPPSLDIIKETKNDIDYLTNIENKTNEELENILNELITKIKEEELDEKNLITIYSNSVYKYNISILNKQIEFVKTKIKSEKNFNIKGSKIHNIDEELKSFLKTSIAPVKIEKFLQENKELLTSKYAKINDIKYAYQVISGNKVELPEIQIIPQINKNDVIKTISHQFDSLNQETKALLILYNSLYKNICNYIINNNYPSKDEILKNFDFKYLYQELEEIVYNENNYHYLNNYFKYINFKNIDTYLESLIKICHTVENTSFDIFDKIKVFYIEENNKYKTLTLTPIFNENQKVYIVELYNNKVLYIPDKIELDDETKEISIITTQNIYLKGNIMESFDTITLNKYSKKQEKDPENNIIITTDLILKSTITFNIGNIIGDNNE